MTDDTPQRFKVIQGGPAEDGKAKPKKYRARRKGDVEPLVCPECNSGMSMEAKTGRMIANNRPEGGSKRLICVHCLAAGKVTILV